MHWVKLSTLDGNATYINLPLVVRMIATHSGTSLDLNDSEAQWVKETPEQIFALADVEPPATTTGCGDLIGPANRLLDAIEVSGIGKEHGLGYGPYERVLAAADELRLALNPAHGSET